MSRSVCGTDFQPWDSWVWALPVCCRPALRPLPTVPAPESIPIWGGGTHWPRSRYEQLTCQGFPKGGLDREALGGKGTGR